MKEKKNTLKSAATLKRVHGSRSHAYQKNNIIFGRKEEQ